MVMSELLCFKLIFRINSKHKPQILVQLDQAPDIKYQKVICELIASKQYKSAVSIVWWKGQVQLFLELTLIGYN